MVAADQAEFTESLCKVCRINRHFRHRDSLCDLKGEKQNSSTSHVDLWIWQAELPERKICQEGFCGGVEAFAMCNSLAGKAAKTAGNSTPKTPPPSPRFHQKIFPPA